MSDVSTIQLLIIREWKKLHFIEKKSSIYIFRYNFFFQASIEQYFLVSRLFFIIDKNYSYPECILNIYIFFYLFRWVETAITYAVGLFKIQLNEAVRRKQDEYPWKSSTLWESLELSLIRMEKRTSPWLSFLWNIFNNIRWISEREIFVDLSTTILTIYVHISFSRYLPDLLFDTVFF